MNNGFENLEQAIPSAEALQTILAKDVAFEDEQLTDEIALGIVLRDVDIAEAFLLSKGVISRMDQADRLYEGYVKPRTWANGKAKSSISMPIVLEAIEKILPSLYMSLFGSGKTPFNLKPTGKTSPKAARAKGKVLEWAIRQADLKEAMRLSLKSALQYGFVVGQWGWEDCDRIIKTYDYDTNGKVVPKKQTITISQPKYECLDLRNVLFDPACKVQNLRKGAGYVIKQKFIDAYELDDLAEDGIHKNVPTRDELRDLLTNNPGVSVDSLRSMKTATWSEHQAERDGVPTSIDPLSQPLEILEYWRNDRVITVLQRCVCIRNEESEFTSLPFPSCAFVDVLNSALGFGVARLIAGEQSFQTGVLNTWVDSLALILNPVFQILKGLGQSAEQVSVSPGKVLNVSAEMKPLIVPSISTEAAAAIEASEERSNRRVGTQGGTNTPTQAFRTASGLQSYQGNVVERLQYFLEIFCDCVFVPVLEAFIEMCQDHMTKEQINQILTEEDGKAYEGDVLEVYQATCRVEVLAGTKLAAKQAAAQLIPQLVALITQEPFQDSLQMQGKKFDYAELLDETLELSGWDLDSLIVDQTPADIQRSQQSNPALVKAQAEAQQEQQKNANALQQIDQKGVNQALVAVTRQAVKSHADQAEQIAESIGEPDGQ